MSRQAKVGALFLAFLALLLFLSPSLSQRSTVLGNHYTLLFNEVNGLRESDGVKLSGVAAGHILEIEFSSPGHKEDFGTEAQVAVHIVTGYGLKIPVDSGASVDGTIGGLRWVEITPGNSPQALRPGDAARLRLKPIQHNELEVSLAGLQEMKQRTAALRASLADPAFRREVKDLASNARFYSFEFKGIAETAQEKITSMDRQLDAHQEALLRQLDRVSAQMDQARRQTQDLAPRLGEEAKAWEARLRTSEPELRSLINQAERETRRFQDLAASAEERLKSADLDGSVRQRLARLAQRTEEIATLAEDLHLVSSSPETQTELREMVARYRRQAEELRRNLERWDKIIP